MCLADKERIKQLDSLNLKLYQACRFAYACLDSKSRSADRIEEKLRLAMAGAERDADRNANKHRTTA
jgi:hypothetical protein